MTLDTASTVMLLTEIAEFLENYSDVVDGTDGPRPNRAMHLWQETQREIGRLNRCSATNGSADDRA